MPWTWARQKTALAWESLRWLRCGEALEARRGRGLLWRVAEAAKISNGTALRVSWTPGPRERGSSLLMDRCPVGGRGKLRHFFFDAAWRGDAFLGAPRSWAPAKSTARASVEPPSPHPAVGSSPCIRQGSDHCPHRTPPLAPPPPPLRQAQAGSRRSGSSDQTLFLSSTPAPPPRFCPSL